MSNYPDGMSMDAFDRATGGGVYEAEWKIRDTIDAEGTLIRAEAARDHLKQQNIGKALEVLDEIIALCMYDANPNNQG